jgi:ribosomal protein S10
MTSYPTIATATTAELLQFFNANTGGAQVKKFADRKTAERRVAALVDEMLAEDQAMIATNPDYQAAVDENNGVDFLEYMERDLAHPDNIAAAEREIAARELEGEDMSTAAIDPVTSAIVKTPKLDRINAKGPRPAMVASLKIDRRIVDLLTGAIVKTPKLDRINAKGPRPAMVASLKIDRRIVDLLTGEEYANACQVWKAGLVSSAQGDRLSAVLYGAFKKTGKRDAICKVNGHSFRLAYL